MLTYSLITGGNLTHTKQVPQNPHCPSMIRAWNGYKREDCGSPCINCKDMKKFVRQGKKKQKCINRMCTAKAKGIVSTLYFRLMAFHYQTFIADQPQKLREMKQKLTENLQSATAAGSQPSQMKQGSLTGDTCKRFTTTAVSSPAKFLPLETSELYTWYLLISHWFAIHKKGWSLIPPHLQNTQKYSKPVGE